MTLGNLRCASTVGFMWRRPQCSPLPSRPPCPKVLAITFGRMTPIILRNLRFPGSVCIPIFHQKREKVILIISEHHDLRRTFGSCHLREGAIPNSSPSWARTDSDRPNPRRKKIGQDTRTKASPPKVGGGRETKVFHDTCRGLIRCRSDFSSILPLGEQCEVTPL